MLNAAIYDEAQPYRGHYFTGEILIDGVSLGSESDQGATWYNDEFSMPAHSVTLSAVQEETEDLTVDLYENPKVEIPVEAFSQLNRNVKMTYDDESDLNLIDLNNSGTPDVGLSIVSEYDGDEIVADHCYAELLQGADAVGVYPYHFTQNTDRFATVSFKTSADPVSTYMRGDADGDGTISILDVTAIQRKLADYSVPSFNEKAANLDGNGLSILDATRIQRYLAEYADPYHIGEIVSYDA